MTPEPNDATPSGLSWGLKRSFVGYLTGMADGTIVADGPAVVEANGMASWPLASSTFDPDTMTGEVRLAGGVRYTGHFGALDVNLTDVRIVCDAGQAELSIADPFEAENRLVLALTELVEVAAAPGYRAWVGEHVALTASGSVLFGTVYAAGEALDALILVATT